MDPTYRFSALERMDIIAERIYACRDTDPTRAALLSAYWREQWELVNAPVTSLLWI